MKSKIIAGMAFLAVAVLMAATYAERAVSQDASKSTVAATAPNATALRTQPVPPAPAEPDAVVAQPAVAQPPLNIAPLPPLGQPSLDVAPDPSGAESKIFSGDRIARGFYLRPDGVLVGQITSIEDDSLLLRPVANANVVFIRDQNAASRTRTDANGMFWLHDLVPWRSYSVIVSNDTHVAMVRTVVRPRDHDDNHWFRRSQESKIDLEPRDRDLEKAKEGTEIEDLPGVGDEQAKGSADGDKVGGARDVARVRLVSTNRLVPVRADGTRDDGTQPNFMDYEFMDLQMIPREDFLYGLQQQFFGNVFPPNNFPPNGNFPPPAGFGGPGGFGGGGAGGGGGGGGGGSGGGGAGAGLGGLGAALGAAAGLLGGDDGGSLASPFK